MGHSLIMPSAASIWGKPEGCTGWVTMAQLYPELESRPEADEGDAAHELSAYMINEATVGRTVRADVIVGSRASNGITYDQDMFDAAEMYANDVVEVMRSTGVFGGEHLGIEKQIFCPEIHQQSYGTTDCFLFSVKLGHLYIWDFKYGYEVVDVFENWQMLNYSAGIIMNHLKLNGHDTQHISVHFRVVQPRAFHKKGPIREWVTIASNLRGYWNVLSTNAHIALSPNATTKSGSHCKHCTAKHACEAALTAGTRLYEAAMMPTPVELTPLQLGVQLHLVKRARQQLEYLESGYEEQVRSLFQSGTLVPGWMIETGKGREAWSKPIAEVIALGRLFGHDLRKPDAAITPNQARKLGIDEKVINAYTVTPSTGIKVIPDNGNKAKQVFNS